MRVPTHPDWISRWTFYGDKLPDYCGDDDDTGGCGHPTKRDRDAPDGQWFRRLDAGGIKILAAVDNHAVSGYQIIIQWKIALAFDAPPLSCEDKSAYVQSRLVLRAKRHAKIDPVTEGAAQHIIKWVQELNMQSILLSSTGNPNRRPALS